MTDLSPNAPPLDQQVRLEPHSTPTDDTGDYFRALFDEHADRVFRTLLSLGVHEASVDDALQDVFLIVHQKLATFEGRSLLSTWIYSITYRVAQNYRRKTNRHAHDEVNPDVRSSALDPLEQVSQGQAARFVDQFCLSLDTSQRDVFVLCVLEEHTAPQAAALLGVPVNTVYSRIRNTRARFRAELSRLRAEEGARES